MDAAVRFYDTFSDTVETKLRHNIEITSNSLADKKKIMFSPGFADCRKNIFIGLSIS